MESSPNITVAHVQAVHDAAHDCDEEAASRDERMPSSASAIRERAVQLREVEGFLLQFIPVTRRASYLPFVSRGPVNVAGDLTDVENE